MALIMVNSETPQNVRATVPVDRSGFKKKFKCLKKKKLPTWNLPELLIAPSCPLRFIGLDASIRIRDAHSYLRNTSVFPCDLPLSVWMHLNFIPGGDILG
jgi:hypothetical protein